MKVMKTMTMMTIMTIMTMMTMVAMIDDSLNDIADYDGAPLVLSPFFLPHR